MLLFLAAGPAPLDAATRTWTGAAGDGLWSNPANWQGGLLPVDGDLVVFSAPPNGVTPAAAVTLGSALSLETFTFGAGSPQMDFHIGGGAAVALTLTGGGLVRETIYPVFPEVYVDPRASLVFDHTVGNPDSYGGLNVHAAGAGAAGVPGGSIVFQGHAFTTIENTGNAHGFIAEGGTAAGASGGTIVFRDDAISPYLSSYYIRGGEVAGAGGGQLLVQDHAWLYGNLIYVGGTSPLVPGAEAATADFSGHAHLSASLSLHEGTLATFRDDVLFDGSVYARSEYESSLGGGHTVFRDRVQVGGPGDGGKIINEGGSSPGKAGGRTDFYDDSGTLASAWQPGDPPPLSLDNGVGEGQYTGARGGVTVFHDRSSAAYAQISNRGAYVIDTAVPGDGTAGGWTYFLDHSTAEGAGIDVSGGYGVISGWAPGGGVSFEDDSTAPNVTIVLYGGSYGGDGGHALFSGNASAPGAFFWAWGGGDPNDPANVAEGGLVRFTGNASADQARVRLEGNGTFDISGSDRPSFAFETLYGSGGLVHLGAHHLTVGGSGPLTGADPFFGGSIDGAGGSLTKVSADDLHLTGVSTYTGPTLVSAGRLFVDGPDIDLYHPEWNGRLAGSSGVTVAAGATLGGTGSVLAPVTLQAGATLAPGGVALPGIFIRDTPGAFTVASVSSVAGVNFNFRLGNAGSDRVDVLGDLALTGLLNIAESGTLAYTTYRLFNYGGTLSGAGLTFGTLPVGFSSYDFTLQTSIAGQINLTVQDNTNTLYWDGPQTAANGAIDGGAGTWIAGTTNWTNASGSLNRDWSGRNAYFAGPAGGAVTLHGALQAVALHFRTNGYVLTGAAGATLTAGGGSDLELDADPNITALLNAALTGVGVSLHKLGDGTIRLGGVNDYDGGTLVERGRLEVDSTQGLGTGPASTAAGAELRFVNTATAGPLTITNAGGTTAFGLTSFVNQATAGAATINNAAAAVAGAMSGRTLFDSPDATAGTAHLFNLGASVLNTLGGQTRFNAGSADHATIVNAAGTASDIDGYGYTDFRGSSTAGAATILNNGAALSGAGGGGVFFGDSANAGTATITNLGSIVATGADSASGAIFSGNSSGGSATILNAAPTAAGGAGGRTWFYFDNASAGQATITNAGSAVTVSVAPTTYIYGTTATAGAATLTSQGGAAAGGRTIFDFGANAGTARLIANGGPAGGQGGLVQFSGAGTTAAGAQVQVDGGSVASGVGGSVTFNDTSTAGAALFNVGGGTANLAGGGTVTFNAQSTAGTALFTVGGGTAAAFNADGGTITFNNQSSAGQATFANHASTASIDGGGEIYFNDTSTAANATITNDGNPVAVGGNRARTYFYGSSTAGQAVIINESKVGDGLSGGSTYFYATSNAGSASLIANGADAPGSYSPYGGGAIYFAANATAANATITANGGSNGGDGGLILFSDAATGGTPRVILNGNGRLDISGLSSSGLTIGSLEGDGDAFLGGKTLTIGSLGTSTTFGGVLHDGGASGGSGGQVVKIGTGTLTLTAPNTFTGSLTVQGGVLELRGDGTLVDGPQGPNHLSFVSAQAELAFYDATVASGILYSRPAAVAGGVGGLIHFLDHAGTRLGQLVQLTSEGGSFSGGSIRFSGSSTAGAALITDAGGQAAGGHGGQTVFDSADATAGTAKISNFGTSTRDEAGNSNGGQLLFQAGSADHATITNSAATNGSGSPGQTFFYGTATAGAAVIGNAGAGNDAPGGQTLFYGSSDAGAATVTNGGSATSFGRGVTTFYDTSSAGSATILNAAPSAAGGAGGITSFTGDSSAGQAAITNAGSSVSTGGNRTGSTNFSGRATAGAATIINQGGTVGGVTFFAENSTAGTARLLVNGGPSGGEAGGVWFYNRSSAGGAQVQVAGGSVASGVGGAITFNNQSSADTAHFDIGGGRGSSAAGGTLIFNSDDATHFSTAGQAVITVHSGAQQGYHGTVVFNGYAQAGQATIVTESPLESADINHGATVSFLDHASAADATITNQGASVLFNGVYFLGGTRFLDNASAGSARLTAGGGSNGGEGGLITFFENSTAANATLTTNGGSNGGGGGEILFTSAATGGTARVIVNGNGRLDLSGLTSAGLTLGSLEGDGLAFLGSKTLTLGGGRATTFSGTLANGGFSGGSGGRLTVTGAGTTLTLSGANTYTGPTTIGAGGKLIADNLSGSATGSGPVTVQAGGTLSGSGHIAGAVTLQAGGVIAPGDPVTLTLEDSLTWDADSTIRLVLGPDDATSDHLDILGALLRGAGLGEFRIELLTLGAQVGQTYDLLHADSLAGFAPGDFHFTGEVFGDFVLTEDTVRFTATAVVPEPGAASLLLAAGIGWLASRRRGRKKFSLSV